MAKSSLDIFDARNIKKGLIEKPQHLNSAESDTFCSFHFWELNVWVWIWLVTVSEHIMTYTSNLYISTSGTWEREDIPRAPPLYLSQLPLKWMGHHCRKSVFNTQKKKTAIAARLLNQAFKCLYPLSPLKRKQSDFILTAHNVAALKASPLHTSFWRPFWLPSSPSQHESHP